MDTHLPIIEVRGISKRYQLGDLGPASLRDAVEGWFSRRRSHPAKRAEAGPTLAAASEFWALRDVTFDIAQGEIVGIVGRNGAGKSTLLKVLSRITEPTAGRAVLRGRVASLLEVGTGFHPELTGRENVFLNGAVLGMKRAEIAAKFDEIVDFAEVGQFIDTPVKRYSSGMYVRLAFAVAAHLEPEILIIDEVLAVGDTAFQKRCLGKMDAVARSGRTVLFVSHQLPAVQTLCSRAILLESGRVICTGPTAQVLERYLTGQATGGDAWQRPATAENRAGLRFVAAECGLRGAQPRAQLALSLRLQSTGSHRPAFIAVDVLNPLGASIMQAVPKPAPFLSDASGEQTLEVVIDLPPLIPGRYSLTLWAGPHYTETFDQVERCLAFEVEESPTPGRSFDHSPDHGYVVPESRVTVLPASPAPTPPLDNPPKVAPAALEAVALS